MLRLRRFPLQLTFAFSLAVAVFLSACEPLGEAAGETLLNPFTRMGSSLKLEDLTTGSELYYGRALVREGSSLYGMNLSFQLRKQGTQGAYFANFKILRLVTLSGLESAIPTLSSPLDLSVPTSFSPALNGLVIRDALDRRVNFSLSFGSNLYLRDISAGAALVSDDFKSLVGGDSDHFHFIAQKATGLSAVAISDLDSIWRTQSFRVDSIGNILLGDSARLQSFGPGGLGLTAFRFFTANGVLRAGEFNFVDAITGLFAFSLDLNPSATGTPRGNGSLDGVFLLSPDRSLILAYDARNSVSFAGGR